MEITIPIINIQISLSTLIAIILLIIIFFTFFSVQIFLGGSLSPEAVAKDVTPCDADPSAFSQPSEDVLGDVWFQPRGQRNAGRHAEPSDYFDEWLLGSVATYLRDGT